MLAQRQRIHRQDVPIEEPPYAEALETLEHFPVVVIVAPEGECFWNVRHFSRRMAFPATSGSEGDKAPASGGGTYKRGGQRPNYRGERLYMYESGCGKERE